MPTCAICTTRDVPDDDTHQHACRACQHRMRYVLAELQRELPLLQAALVPGGAGPKLGSRFGGRAHAPLPLDARVLDLLGPGSALATDDLHGEQVPGTPLLPLLRHWADRLADAFPSRHTAHGTVYVLPYGGCDHAVSRGGTDIAGWCRWLTRYLPYAAHLALVVALHEDLDDALARVRAITRTQPATHPRLAPCPACGACAMSLTDGQWEIRCEACRHEMEPDAYDAHAAAVLPALGLIMARIAGGSTTRA